MTIKEALDEALTHSDEEILELAKKATSIIKQYYKNEIGMRKEETFSVLCDFWKLFVSSDKFTSKSEYNLFIKTFDFEEIDFSFDDFIEITNGGSHPLFIRHMKAVLDSLPENVKTACLYLGIQIMVIDRNVSDLEFELLSTLVG